MYLSIFDVATTIFSIILLIIILTAIISTYKSNKAINAFIIASGFYLLVYGIVPAFFVFNKGIPNKFNSIFGTHTQYSIILFSILCYLIFWLSYVVARRLKIAPSKGKSRSFKVTIKSIEGIAWFTFLLGLLGFIIEINMYGGLWQSFNNIEIVRGFKETEIEDGINNPLVFFRLFKFFIIFSFYIFYVLKNTTNKLLYKIMFFLTLTQSLYILFLNGGRTHIFIFIGTLILADAFIKTKKKNAKRLFLLIFGIFIALFSLIILDPLFSYLTYGGSISYDQVSLARLLAQFSFPYSNLGFVLNNEFDFRFFKDTYLWVISLLPAFILSRIGFVQTSPLYEYNTLLQNGTMLFGGIPSDILTWGFFQLGIVGCFLVIAIFGFILGKVDNIIEVYNNNILLAPIIIRIAFYIGMMVMYADLESLFRVRYDVVLLILFLVVLKNSKISLLKPHY
ncbi:O-antigen polymerase [Thalassobacillus pellis]|uniref:O-antigen polymerase n=1 Tax=Thalassobacillus pellis TaxID=748008 RepID=UPI00195F7386|nr:O-antigen polymerase [Thalassobacillus pellis]MBM7551660.1 hypothetical protein [Thalassobacillus pellis]